MSGLASVAIEPAPQSLNEIGGIGAAAAVYT
jgi:hypothetical protein